MNSNIEYEKFTQEVYQKLVNADVVKTTEVKHNVKLIGKSGQKHQIDVYWEYEIAGVRHKVAIECKNYNQKVPVGKVRDFYGVLSDLNNVSGIMVTKIGYQEGAKQYASHCGINLMELRTPNKGEGIIGETTLNIDAKVRHCLFLVDEEWAKANNLNLQLYKERLDFMSSFSWPPRKPHIRWSEATHIPLPTKDGKIRDGKGQTITIFDELDTKLSENFEKESDTTFNFQDAYIDTTYWGPVKIKEVKYVHETKNQTTVISIDAQEFIKAILKDAESGKIKLIIMNKCHKNNHDITDKNTKR